MKRSFFRMTRLVALVLALGAPALASAALRESGSSRVTFTATGSGGLRIVGNITELSVADDGTNVTVTVPLAHLSTGIGMRDDHTKNTLDVAHHGTATLVVPRAALQFPTGSSVSADTHGTMKIHGQTHDVTFHYTAEPASGGIRVSASTKVDITHYGIEQPSYLGVRVNRQVDVSATFQVADR